MLHYGVSVN